MPDPKDTTDARLILSFSRMSSAMEGAVSGAIAVPNTSAASFSTTSKERKSTPRPLSIVSSAQAITTSGSSSKDIEQREGESNGANSHSAARITTCGCFPGASVHNSNGGVINVPSIGADSVFVGRENPQATATSIETRHSHQPQPSMNQSTHNEILEFLLAKVQGGPELRHALTKLCTAAHDFQQLCGLSELHCLVIVSTIDGSRTLYPVFSKLLLTALRSSTSGAGIACSAIADGFRVARLIITRAAYSDASRRSAALISQIQAPSHVQPAVKYSEWFPHTQDSDAAPQEQQYTIPLFILCEEAAMQSI